MKLDVIHNEDCLAGMRKHLPDSSIDLTVTSPPYDQLRKYNGYTFDFEGIARELYRVTKPGGVVVWVVGDATVKGSETGTSFRQALYFRDACGFNLHDTMIWHKAPKPLSHDRYEQHFEYVFILSKGRPTTFNGIKDKPNTSAGRIIDGTWRDVDGSTHRMSGFKRKWIAAYGLRGNVWDIPPSNGNERKGHPATFPESLARDHILSWSNEGDVVLDPFMGSGTTAKMAAQLNRRYIGFEISAEYCKIAHQRVA